MLKIIINQNLMYALTVLHITHNASVGFRSPLYDNVQYLHNYLLSSILNMLEQKNITLCQYYKC